VLKGKQCANFVYNTGKKFSSSPFVEKRRYLVAEKRIDPNTGDTWIKAAPPLHKRPSFSWGLALLCCVLGGLLWWLAKPTQVLSQEGLHTFAVVQSLVTGHGYSVPMGVEALQGQGQWLPEVSVNPLYPFLLAGLSVLVSPNNPVNALPLLHYVNLGFYLASIVAFYWLARLYLKQPLHTLATLLYTVAPITLHAAMDLSPLPLFTCLALRSLRLLDKAFEKKDAKPDRETLQFCGILILLACATHPLGLALVGVFLWKVVRRLGLVSLARWGVVTALLLAPAVSYRLYVSHWMGTNHPGLTVQERKPLFERQAPKLQTVGVNGSQAIMMLSMATLGNPVVVQTPVPLSLSGALSTATKAEALAPAYFLDHLDKKAPSGKQNVWQNSLQWLKGIPFVQEVLAVGVSLLLLTGLGLFVFQGSGGLGLYGLMALGGLAVVTGFSTLTPIVALFPVAVLAFVRCFQWLLGTKVPGVSLVLVSATGLIVGSSLLDYVLHRPQLNAGQVVMADRWVSVPTLMSAQALEASSSKRRGEEEAFSLRGVALAADNDFSLREEVTQPVVKPVAQAAKPQGKGFDVVKLVLGLFASKAKAPTPTTTTAPELLVPPVVVATPATAIVAKPEPSQATIAAANAKASLQNRRKRGLLEPGLVEAASWLALETSPQVRVMTPAPLGMAQPSGRRTSAYPAKAPVATMLQAVNSVQFVVVPHTQEEVYQGVFLPLQRAYSERFHLLFTSSDRSVSVWRVLPVAAASAMAQQQ
jgi:hypothetical protein